MPAKVKVRILAGRNLPVMDKSSDASDAFVEVKLGTTTYKTEVYRRSLNPFWNSEWFRFEVSDQELQDEPLQIRIMDYDTYSANDAIGKVYINLNPLLLNPGRSMNGWLPIYDTLHGIRGEINCMVKVNLFADNNRFRHSSCGVRFFFSDVPNGYKCDAILGFVDELLVNDDPEYQWIDKIRTPRASNEARQTLFTKLSGEVQRKLGLKAEVFGGNAVIGYQQSFDLEGSSGIVGRGTGTAVVLSKIGHQYEGVISPLSLCNFNIPYPYLSNISQGISRSASHYFPFQKTTQDRHLVHSLSADYFYEVPSKPPSKKTSNALDSLLSIKSISNAVSNSDQNDASDLETFVSLQSLADDETDTETDEKENSSERAEQADDSSLKRKSTNKSRRLMFAAFSTNKDEAPLKCFQSIKSSKSTNSFLNKLISNNDAAYNLVVQKLVDHVKKPVLSQATNFKLIRKLSRRKSNPTAGAQVTGELSSHASKPMREDLQQDFDGPSGSSSRQRSTHSPGSHSRNTTATAQSIGSNTPPGKTRKDRLLTPSNIVDDALSIIEEKLDDDDTGLLKPTNTEQATRSRLLSSSSGRSRQFVRSKEMDLGGESEQSPAQQSSSASSQLMRQKKISVSSIDSGDAEETVVSDSLSILTIETKTSPLQTTVTGADSIESTSSPSVSLLTDETIKENDNPVALEKSKPSGVSPPPPPPLASEQSLKSSHKNRRQDTDPTDLRRGEVQDAENKTPQSFDGNKRKHSLKHSKTSQSVGPKTSNQNPNFVQSVKAVKAQQHLLQNIIKHQNQNLVVSSMQKAKNAFMYPNRIHQSEYPFVTLKRYPDGLIQCTGGVVSAHSVKLLNHSINDEESETRDIWWTELRKEIRSHAKSLNCNTILGYSETSKVLGDVCILSARGTAAVMKPIEDTNNGLHLLERHRHYASGNALRIPHSSVSPAPPATHASMPPHQRNESPCNELQQSTSGRLDQQEFGDRGFSPDGCDQSKLIDCSFGHTPLICVESIEALTDCSVCKSRKVPDVLLLTIEPPKNLNIVSPCVLVQARVCRIKRDSHGEASAKEIGDALPFLEYELHRQLFSKLKFKGMNCLFNLSIDISIGENMLTGLATGTGCFVLGLPVPEVPQIAAGKGIKAIKLSEIRKLISLSALKNRQLLGLEEIERKLSEYHRELGYNCSELSTDDRREADETADDNIEGSQNRKSQEKSNTPKQSVDRADSADQRPSSSIGLSSQVGDQRGDSINSHCGDQSTATASPKPKIAEIGESSRNQNNKRLHVDQSKRSSQRSTGSTSDHHRNHRSHKHGHEHGHHHQRHHHHNRKSPRLSTTIAPTENLINMLGDSNNIVLEVDDNEDADIIALLIDSDIPEGFLICNSETLPVIDPQAIESINMFTQVIRVKLTGLDQFAQQFDWVLQALMVKQRRSLPCCLTNLNFVVDLPEAHVVQITVTGTMLGLRAPSSVASSSVTLDMKDGMVSNKTREVGRKLQAKKRKQLDKKTASSTSMSPISLTPSSNVESDSPSSSEIDSGEEAKSTLSSSSSSSSSSSATTSESSKGANTSSSNPGASKKERLKTALEPLKAENPISSNDSNDRAPSGETKQSTLAKQFSKGNIVALINAGKSTFSDRKFRSSGSRSADKIELTEVPSQAIALSRPSQHQNQRQQERPTRSLRIVFKKQQTYPGAVSPPISGHESLLTKLSMRKKESAAKLSNVPGGDRSQQEPITSATTAAEIVSHLSSISKAHAHQASSTTTDEQSLNVDQPHAEQSRSTGHHSRHRRHHKHAARHQYRSASAANQELILSSRRLHQQRNDYSLTSSIDITSLSYIPGAREYHYLGNLTFSFVRETNSVRENGGLNGFIHSFLMEVYAIVRAHVSALGGNAFLSFRLQQSCIFYHSNKNQAQCLISVAGDAVQVTI